MKQLEWEFGFPDSIMLVSTIKEIVSKVIWQKSSSYIKFISVYDPREEHLWDQVQKPFLCQQELLWQFCTLWFVASNSVCQCYWKWCFVIISIINVLVIKGTFFHDHFCAIVSQLNNFGYNVVLGIKSYSCDCCSYTIYNESNVLEMRVQLL